MEGKSHWFTVFKTENEVMMDGVPLWLLLFFNSYPAETESD